MSELSGIDKQIEELFEMVDARKMEGDCEYFNESLESARFAIEHEAKTDMQQMNINALANFANAFSGSQRNDIIVSCVVLIAKKLDNIAAEINDLANQRG